MEELNTNWKIKLIYAKKKACKGAESLDMVLQWDQRPALVKRMKFWFT
jgi:hypothetical protein